MNFSRLWIFMAIPLWAGTAVAQPPDDPGHTLTIQIENDSSRRTSDMYYTSGERLAYTSPTGALPAPLSDLGHSVPGRWATTIRFRIVAIYLHSLQYQRAESGIYRPALRRHFNGHAVADPRHRHQPHRACGRPGRHWTRRVGPGCAKWFSRPDSQPGSERLAYPGPQPGGN